jgi:Fe-S cluster biogenesis protein NfuA
MYNTLLRRTPMKEKIEEALKKVRPSLQADGGDVELVGYEDGVVKLRLKGACGGCPMSQMTLKMGIERILKKEIPEIKEVQSI